VDSASISGIVRPSRFFASSSLSRLDHCKRLPERDRALMRLSIVGSARPPISLRRRVRVALFAGRDIHASHTLPSALSRHGSGPVLSFLPRSAMFDLNRRCSSCGRLVE
jgi:hypothetical protein